MEYGVLTQADEEVENTQPVIADGCSSTAIFRSPSASPRPLLSDFHNVHLLPNTTPSEWRETQSGSSNMKLLRILVSMG
jgi:hypothetical protein